MFDWEKIRKRKGKNEIGVLFFAVFRVDTAQECALYFALVRLFGSILSLWYFDSGIVILLVSFSAALGRGDRNFEFWIFFIYNFLEPEVLKPSIFCT